MSWQHIHSARGDKEVLPRARGQEEIGGRKREHTKQIEQMEDGEVWRESKNEGRKKRREGEQMWYGGKCVSQRIAYFQKDMK